MKRIDGIYSKKKWIKWKLLYVCPTIPRPLQKANRSLLLKVNKA